MSALPGPPTHARDWALYLDLDGTLAPLRPHPDDVVVDDGTLRTLADLHARLDGAVCIVSGRSVQALRRLLATLPQLRLVGCHGGEGLDLEGHGLPPALVAVRDALADVVHRFDGAWLEDKATGFALHYRACPEAGDSLRREAAAAVAGADGLRMIAGSAVVEVLPAHVSKGAVLEHLARQAPFRGRVPVAVGDDVTDEDSFEAAHRLGGFGVRVGHRTPTRARYGLADVVATTGWLRKLVVTGADA